MNYFQFIKTKKYKKIYFLSFHYSYKKKVIKKRIFNFYNFYIVFNI